MQETVAALESAVRAWRDRGWPRPNLLVVAGSGLGVDLSGERVVRAPLQELLPFDVLPLPGHDHEIELLSTPAGEVLYQRGRLHAYQGYDANEVVFVTRLAILLGARAALFTNAAGAIDAEDPPGSLRLLRDHLNWMGMNPIRGRFPEAWGPPFPDMTDAYSPELRGVARAIGAEHGHDLRDGVYAGVLGPSFETPAEVAMLAGAGANLVGMSTVLEVIAARHFGVPCLGLSLVTNPAAGTTAEPVDHEAVLEECAKVTAKLAPLFDALVQAVLSTTAESG